MPDAIAKRRRVENDSSELHQDPDLWLSDGNVVLTSKDDEGTTWGFKCHRSTLSKHSTVFESMFTVVQPEDAETYEGLPLVALTDGYADLKGLLQILCDPLQYLPEPSDPTMLRWQEDLRKISGPLKLSRKYEFESIRRKLIAFLELRWPVTLDRWDKIAEFIRDAQDTAEWVESKDISLEVNPGTFSCYKSQLVSFTLTASSVSTILLGEAAEVMSILPAAYYTLHTSWRMASFATTATDKYELEMDYYPPRGLTELSSQHLVRFIEGSHCLRKAVWQLLAEHLPDNLFASCKCVSDRGNCRKDMQKWLHDKQEIFGEDLFLDPLWVLREMQDAAKGLIDHPSKYVHIGLGCRFGLERALGACGEYIWAELPYFFGLKPRKEGRTYGYDQYL